MSFNPRRRELMLGAVGAAALAAAAPPAAAPAPAPAPAIGVNCFDLLYGLIVAPQRTRSPQVRLGELASRAIPFVRHAASPYWPSEWTLYLRDKPQYFALFDTVVQAAEQHKVGLVPSVFFNPTTISDLAGEPVSDWGRDGSRTQDFMLHYIGDVVPRYKGSSAIWAWEFGNEFNAYDDLPNALHWWPQVNTSAGTPARRSPRDLIHATDTAAAIRRFAQEVKRLDPAHPVTSGCDLPRFDATHLAGGHWEADDPGQFRAAISAVNPDPVDVVSIHIYPDREGKFFGNPRAGFAEILGESAAAARAMGKRLFVGEFGVPRSGDHAREQEQFRRLLDALAATRVDWAALWVYDFADQRDSFSVTLGGDRAYQLDWIQAFNTQGALPPARAES